ncbi:MAG: TIGR03663 family protein, partial [Chloroflexia bacterium]|nr:TIGR03663 family protein [Chloroflexia bacterium]
MAEENKSERHERSSWLDRRLDLTRVDPQLAIFAALLLAAVLLRFWDLGQRAMHHDESLHAWMSWRFYTGQDLYQYDPTYHGPFLYHVTALFYLLFGVSDAVARAPQALFGLLLVALCYPLRRWLGRWGWLIAAGLFALSPSFTYFARFARHDSFVAVWTLGLVLALFRYLQKRQPRDLLLAAAALALSFCTKELTFITLFILGSFVGLAYLLDLQGRRFQVESRIGAGVLLAISFLLALRLTLSDGGGVLGQSLVLALLLLSLGYLLLSLAWSRVFPEGGSPLRESVQDLVQEPRPLFAALGVFGVLFGLLFTTLLTHPRGFLDGLVRGLEYWMQQQGVRRGGQPWFYYLLLLPVYEPVVLSAGVAGLFVALRRTRAAAAPAANDSRPAHPAAAQRLFYAFLAYWAISSLVFYSWAGEKMPWLILHIALPLTLLAALALDRLAVWLSRSWSALWRSGDWVVGPIFLVLVLSLRGLTALAAGQVAHELAAQYMRLQIAVLVLVFLGLIALLAWRIYRIEGRHLGQSFALVGLALLLLYTVRSTFLLNYYHGDVPVEMLVYTQTAPDVPLVVRQIERLSIDQTRTERTAEDPTGGHGLRIAIDTSRNAALEWPFNWYLRDFDRLGNLVPFHAGQNAPPSADVVLVLADNEPALRPSLANEYTGLRLKHRWWFPEFDTYKRWSLLQTGQNDLGYDYMPWLRGGTYAEGGFQQGWLHLWDYLLNRELPYPLGSQDFFVYIRNDILPTAGAAGDEDPYIGELSSRLAAGSLGSAGSGPGQLSAPRDVAVGPAGDLYVADAGNHRIVRFDPSGMPSSWGGFCDLATGSGCLTPEDGGPLGAGQFNEPWGVAVDGEGRVYVADTWNHRIQVFDAAGQFLGQWGEGLLIDAELDPRGRAGARLGFYGPRALTVDEAGRVYVVDTGNERVLAYQVSETAAGEFRATYVYQFGTMGPNTSEFLEPVGIAVDASGRVFVVDTLNGRVQVFAPGADPQA